MPKKTTTFRLEDDIWNLVQIVNQIKNKSSQELFENLVINYLKNEDLYKDVKAFLSDTEFKKYEKYLTK